MSDEAEIPTVDSGQVTEISTLATASHTQMCTLKYGDDEDSRIYVVMWDGEFLRLMQPYAVDPEKALITYKILGHLEVSLPKILDPVTMERQAQVLVASYHDGLNSTEDESAEEE
jgi:hypothetical protein